MQIFITANLKNQMQAKACIFLSLKFLNILNQIFKPKFKPNFFIWDTLHSLRSVGMTRRSVGFEIHSIRFAQSVWQDRVWVLRYAPFSYRLSRYDKTECTTSNRLCHTLAKCLARSRVYLLKPNFWIINIISTQILKI